MSSAGRFEIYLAWSEATLVVEASETALAKMLAAGIPVEAGCETGGCGTCATVYVEGDIVHKDTCLTKEDRAHLFCPCVSRARTRIVLAL